MSTSGEQDKPPIDVGEASVAAAAPAPAAADVSVATAPVAASPTSDVQVFRPADVSTPLAPVDDSFFEPTLSDVQASHASIMARSHRLNDAPLLTAKHRDAAMVEREKRKAEKWPTTTIRVKFSDGTQIQKVFPSTSRIQPVYAFVRESLAPSAAGKEFTLYQPPRTLFPENPAPVDPKAKSSAAHPNPAMRSRVVTPAGYNRTAGLQGGTGGAETLTQLGLVPQSMLLIRWEDAAMNASAAVAPITPELAATVALLPTPQVKDSAEDKKSIAKKLTGGAGDVKMPKWLQKGLMKKK